MKWLVALTMLCIGAFSSAQTLDEYVALRKKHNIVRPTRVDDLDLHLGTKILEIRCKVVGVMELDGKTSLSVQYSDGGEQIIDATTVPDWLKGGQTDARILIKAVRSQQHGALQADFIGAAVEAEIAKIEAAQATRAAKTTKTASRSGAPVRTTTSSSTGQIRYTGDKIVGIYAAFIKNHNKKLTAQVAYDIAYAVIGWSRKFDVDARLVMALLIAESDFKPNDLSHTGAQGLGQLMPETARELGVKNAWNTNENLYGTVKLLRQHFDRYGISEDNYDKLALALAAYNAGPGAVKKHGGVPPYRETQNYVRKVIRIFKELRGY